MAAAAEHGPVRVDPVAEKWKCARCEAPIGSEFTCVTNVQDAPVICAKCRDQSKKYGRDHSMDYGREMPGFPFTCDVCNVYDKHAGENCYMFGNAKVCEGCWYNGVSDRVVLDPLTIDIQPGVELLRNRRGLLMYRKDIIIDEMPEGAQATQDEEYWGAVDSAIRLPYASFNVAAWRMLESFTAFPVFGVECALMVSVKHGWSHPVVASITRKRDCCEMNPLYHNMDEYLAARDAWEKERVTWPKSPAEYAKSAEEHMSRTGLCHTDLLKKAAPSFAAYARICRGDLTMTPGQ